MEKQKILLFWSGGKDSNLTLTRLKKNEQFDVVGLVSVINPAKNTVKFHGIPEALLVDQAKLLNVPLIRIYIEENASNEEYLDIICKKLLPFTSKGIKQIAFGDIHLEDVKAFRIKMCEMLKANAVFPLWGESHEKLLNEYFELNHQAIVTSVDRSKLDNSYLAKLYDREWIARLPKDIDPMGENGEFHTFATFSPYFKMRIPFSKTIAIEEGPYTVSMLKEP